MCQCQNSPLAGFEPQTRSSQKGFSYWENPLGYNPRVTELVESAELAIGLLVDPTLHYTNPGRDNREIENPARSSSYVELDAT